MVFALVLVTHEPDSDIFFQNLGTEDQDEAREAREVFAKQNTEWKDIVLVGGPSFEKINKLYTEYVYDNRRLTKADLR